MGEHDKVIVNGKVKVVDSVDRGQPLIMSERRWRRRFWRLSALIIVSLLAFLVLFATTLLLVFNYAFSYEEWARRLIWVVCPAGLAIFALAMFLGLARFFKRGGPAPGLYANGVQPEPGGAFIPYKEIRSARYGRYLMFRTVVFEFRERRGGQAVPWGSRHIFAYMLGREGIERLRLEVGKLQGR